MLKFIKYVSSSACQVAQVQSAMPVRAGFLTLHLETSRA